MPPQLSCGAPWQIWSLSKWLIKCFCKIEKISDTEISNRGVGNHQYSWWRHLLETFSTLLALCAGNSPVTGEFPSQRPVTRSFDVFFDLRLIKRLSKHSCGWLFETPPRSLWRHSNVYAFCPQHHKAKVGGGGGGGGISHPYHNS